jgi:hypothetical protein
MIMPGVFSRVDEILQPIASIRVGGPIALVITLITTFYLYGASADLHLYTQLQPFKKKPGKHIAILALLFFVAAILIAFLLGFAISSKDSLVAPEGYYNPAGSGLLIYGGAGHMLLKMAMTGFFVLLFTFLSVSAGMMAAYLYGRYVDERRPSPIFLNEELLIRVVLDAVRKQLGNGGDIRTLGMERTEKGGVSLTLLHGEKPFTEGGKVIQKEKTWLVTADCWGRVNKIEEKSTRLLQAS